MTIKAKEATIRCPHCGEKIKIRKIEVVESEVKDKQKSVRELIDIAFKKVFH